MKMYQLIQSGCASMFELEEYYTLDEALKLSALVSMRQDVEAMHATEIRRREPNV